MDPTSRGQGAILRSHSTLVLHVSESAFVSRKKLKTPGSEKEKNLYSHSLSGYKSNPTPSDPTDHLARSFSSVPPSYPVASLVFPPSPDPAAAMARRSSGTVPRLASCLACVLISVALPYAR
jgi:hypothetical protein